MRNHSWIFIAVLVLASPLASADQPAQRSDAPPASPTAPAAHAQSPIGRALAGLLQQASSHPDARSTHADTSLDGQGDPARSVQAVDAAATKVQAEPVEVAVH